MPKQTVTRSKGKIDGTETAPTMNRTPWALWNTRTGQPAAGAETEGVRAAPERAFATQPAAWDHPGLCMSNVAEN